MIDILLLGLFCFIFALIPYREDIAKKLHHANIQSHRKKLKRVGRRGLTQPEYDFCIRYKIIR